MSDIMKHRNPKVIEDHINNELGYSLKYDAYYNIKTREWLEEACKEPGCDYCNERPEKHE